MKIKVHEGMEITINNNIKLIAFSGNASGCTECEIPKYLNISQCPFDCSSLYFIKKNCMPYKVNYFNIICPFCGYDQKTNILLENFICPNCREMSKKPVNF